MLEIINERGEVMELDPGTVIPMERNNPLFNDSEKFFQDISYPGKAPISPNNKAFFANGHLVDAPNSVYEFPVQVKVHGFHLFSAVLSYKITSGFYDFTLKVNFGALANQFKTVKLTDIKTYDHYRPSVLTATGWEDYMKSTCENPQSYPYAFFPVFNDGVTYKGEQVSTTTNFWDYAAQSFRIRPPDGQQIALDYMMFNTPFYKLTYILKKVIEAMGFKATGNFFNAENDTIYIWNPFNVTNWNSSYQSSAIYLSIQHSMFYAPSISIYDFFKILREDPRLKAVFNFDLFNTTIRVDSYYDMVADNDSQDISEYVEEVTDIEVKTNVGFTITLAPDSLDNLFLMGSKHMASEKLVIGDGSKGIEINSNTLKIKDADTTACKRGVFKSRAGALLATNPLPLRLIRYTGMRLVEPGKYKPHSEPINLTTEHAEFYQFLVNAKKLKIKARLPITDVNINTNKKICFYYNGVTNFALVERMRYDISERSRLMASIEAYSLNTPTDRILARVEPVTVADAEGESISLGEGTIDQISAYFNTGITNITSVKPICVKDGFTLTAAEIKASTSELGIGGQKGVVVRTSGSGWPESYQLRIFEAKPKYAERMGVRYEFADGPGYWYTTINETLINYSPASVLGGYFSELWIVF